VRSDAPSRRLNACPRLMDAPSPLYFRLQFYFVFVTVTLVRRAYGIVMHDSERTDDRNIETIVRWYVASLRPAPHGLKEHLAERRTIAEVLARRHHIELALASPRRASITDRSRGTSLRVSRSRAAIALEMRARAARYRELARSLVDPIVVEVVETCAHELEAEIPVIESRRRADESHAAE
jgi:hypothetical protein